ncbi:unnamed protein product [Vitrella brassicaformis CCMP3155]|uniref:Uncharacterized protein n=1 Tax=Vitrella brassicaformis (strain CCMP3155) TaxID=1169540 RepID=A0A0G4GL41_VITBC|nr:unnamed protein product [Vitrella brassicaformis CCMP3155]|eukprot:CEM30746.1 unnamed protein product [Vitrella brassicaformis CCMP3155]
MTHSRSSSDDSLDFEKAFDKEHQLLLETLGEGGLRRYREAYERLYKQLQNSRANERQLQEERERLRATQARVMTAG